MQELDGSRMESRGCPMEGSKHQMGSVSLEMSPPPPPGRDGESSPSPRRIVWPCPRAAARAVVLAGCAVALAGGVCALALLTLLSPRPHQQQQEWTLPCREHGHNLESCSLEVDTAGATLTVTVPRASAEPALLVMDARHRVVCWKEAASRGCLVRSMTSAEMECLRLTLQQVNVTTSTMNDTGTVKKGSEAPDQADEELVLGSTVRALCSGRPPTRGSTRNGKGNSLMHFCVDLCFPSNTCITVCLYYSPYF